MKIKALGHHVLVQVPEVEQKTKGGLFLPDQVRQSEQRNAELGVVIEVGPTAWMAEGLGGTPWAKAGDKVWFAKYAGKWITHPEHEDQKVLILLDTDIVARLEE